jgi:hypothetical protein
MRLLCDIEIILAGMYVYRMCRDDGTMDINIAGRFTSRVLTSSTDTHPSSSLLKDSDSQQCPTPTTAQPKTTMMLATR